jgi:hypothetical protein
MAPRFASAQKIKCQGTCKPGSVHPLRGSATIPLGRKLPPASSDQPGRRAETGPCAAPIRSCTRWGLPCRARCRPRGALLPHPFALTRPKACGMLSVALSLIPAEAGTAGRYPAPLFRGARTFLAPLARAAAARSPGRGDIGKKSWLFESDCPSPSQCASFGKRC